MPTFSDFAHGRTKLSPEPKTIFNYVPLGSHETSIRPIFLGLGCVMTAHMFCPVVYFVTLGFVLGNKSSKCLARVFVPLEKNLLEKSNVSPNATYEFSVMLVDFFKKKFYTYLPCCVCMSVYLHVCITPLCTWCPWRSEKGIRCPGTKFQMVVSHLAGARNGTQAFC